MNASKRRAIAGQLVDLAARLKGADTLPASARFVGFAVGQERYGLAGEDTFAFDEMLSTLLQQGGWVEKYSETYIANQLRTLLGKLHGDNNLAKAEQLLEDLDAEYQEYHRKHT